MDEATAVFDAERPRLVGLAYRLLGSLADAEDVVQEAWLRWERADRGTIEQPAAWLTTVTSRLGLDRLRARQRDRAEYVGPWLPEPILAPVDQTDPARQAELSDSLTTAFLLLLEELKPAERLVLLLADVFDEPFEEIGAIVGKSPEACRQVASRARRKVRGLAPERAAGPLRRDRAALEVAYAFAAAALRGDEATVLDLLAPEVVLVSDGGKDHHAARRPVIGPHRVGRLLVNLSKRLPSSTEAVACWVNGSPGFLVRVRGKPLFTQAFEVVDGRIRRVTIVTNPEKLSAATHDVVLS
jgi:RNA polymerase sigma-70 factor (ECF subfamily)